MNNKYSELSKSNKSDRGVILFDSTCVMCLGIVRFLLKHNKKENLFFTSIDSLRAKELKLQFGIQPDYRDSLIFIYQDNCFMKSAGSFQICKQLDTPLNWLYYLSFLVIKPIGDWFYDLISKNRLLFNKNRDTCNPINPEHQFRFI